MTDHTKSAGDVEAREAAVDQEWQYLCEKVDRTSPAEFPDMVLITRDELGEAISQGINAYLAKLTTTKPEPPRRLTDEDIEILDGALRASSSLVDVLPIPSTKAEPLRIAEIRERHAACERDPQYAYINYKDDPDGIVATAMIVQGHTDRFDLLTELTASQSRERALEAKLKLHAGDTLSLDNEIRDARAEIAQLDSAIRALSEERDGLRKEAIQLRRLVIGTHRLWSNKDTDKHNAPNAIKDRNGDIALAVCRDCGAGEIELEQGVCPALTSENKALKEALKPFAKAAEMFAWPVSDPSDHTKIALGTLLTAGDLCRARAALNPSKPREG